MPEDRSHAETPGHPPGVDRLTVAQEAAQRALDGLAAVGDAESTIGAARVADLMEQQEAAALAWSRAADQLAAAEKDGGTAPTAAAWTRYEQAYAEFARVVDTVIAETIHGNHAELHHLHEVSHHMHRLFDADLAMLDELAARHGEPPTPPAEGNQGS